MGSMLALQLDEPSWVAEDLEQYIDIAVALASSPEKLRSNRKNQREKWWLRCCWMRNDLLRNSSTFSHTDNHRIAVGKDAE